jgi:hypothetical protein
VERGAGCVYQASRTDSQACIGRSRVAGDCAENDERSTTSRKEIIGEEVTARASAEVRLFRLAFAKKG